MNKSNKSLNNITINFFLDITEEVCPMTFVKTKLLIEKMKPGQIAEVLIKGNEPLENVPRSVKEYGHDIISLETNNIDHYNNSIYQLIFKKN
tara:strand:+ start:59 stop:334 length:276 start_codon:yes stop_codon:yes gene_type:complete